MADFHRHAPDMRPVPAQPQSGPQRRPRAEAIASRARLSVEEQNPRVSSAIQAFLSAAREEQLAPERFYLGNPSEPWHRGFKVFHWERYVGDGQSVRVSVVVSVDGRVSFGDHDGGQPLFGSDSEMLPFHLGGNQGWSPLSAGWESASNSEEVANVVATADWFVQCLAKYLEDHPSSGHSPDVA